MLNISLVLYFFRHELKKDNVWTENMVKNSILIFILYLGIFSNILQSVILAVFTGVLLLGKKGKDYFSLRSGNEFLRRIRYIALSLLSGLYHSF